MGNADAYTALKSRSTTVEDVQKAAEVLKALRSVPHVFDGAIKVTSADGNQSVALCWWDDQDEDWKVSFDDGDAAAPI